LAPHDHQLVDARGGAPDLAGTSEELTDVRTGIGKGQGSEGFGVGVEADEGVAAEIAQPDVVAFVDINGGNTAVVMGDNHLFRC
jgi:hypothetical protein